MNILAVESSCDETAVAIVKDGREVLCDCIASQVDLHRIYGGVVPEIASRKHIEAIYGLADQALLRANMTRSDIDAVAVTYAPGLIGAVLVGVNFAKAAAMADKPARAGKTVEQQNYTQREYTHSDDAMDAMMRTWQEENGDA